MTPQRPSIEGGEARQTPQAAGLDRDGNRRRGADPLGLVSWVEGAFAVDPRRLGQLRTS